MADILNFALQKEPVSYSVDISLYPDNLEFTVSRIKTDAKSLLKIADELEKIARIIRTDVVTGIAQ